MSARRKVIKSDRQENSTIRYVGGSPISATIRSTYTLTLDCGHVANRPRPMRSAKCPEGCDATTKVTQ